MRRQYGTEYDSNDAENVSRIIKQVGDARYAADRSGHYMGASASDDPVTEGAELGAFTYLGHQSKLVAA